MKKFDFYKTIQLIIAIILTAIGFIIILTNYELYRMIATNRYVMILCIILWLSFATTFIFIFIDFSISANLKRQNSELNFAVYSDPISGIANRNSCDVIIDKYLNSPLPNNIGCITLNLDSLAHVNQEFGHIKGNSQIREFSSILLDSSHHGCFIGRNGGNKFLAIFENCTKEKMDSFIEKIDDKTQKYNAQNDIHIEYSYGKAFNEEDNVASITKLIALSNSRSFESK